MVYRGLDEWSRVRAHIFTFRLTGELSECYGKDDNRSDLQLRIENIVTNDLGFFRNNEDLNGCNLQTHLAYMDSRTSRDVAPFIYFINRSLGLLKDKE